MKRSRWSYKKIPRITDPNKPGAPVMLDDSITYCKIEDLREKSDTDLDESEFDDENVPINADKPSKG